jgi:hypothetical protein
MWITDGAFVVRDIVVAVAVVVEFVLLSSFGR